MVELEFKIWQSGFWIQALGKGDIAGQFKKKKEQILKTVFLDHEEPREPLGLN